MKSSVAVWAVLTLLLGACSNHKVLKETGLSPGTKIDRGSIYLGWIDFGGDEEWYKYGYQNKEDWQQLITTLNQSYNNWVGTYAGARAPADKPGEGKILVKIWDVRIPANLRDGNKEVSAVVTFEEVGSQKKLHEATVSLKADSWGFESALNQATFNLAEFVAKRLGQLAK